MNNRHKRRLRRLAKKGNISGYLVDEKNKTVMILTKDILTNQIYREGPNIAGSFDELGRGDINDCSEVFSRTLTMLVRRGGSGNLDSGDKWNFCLTSA